MSGWITVSYNDFGEIENPEFVGADNYSAWWVDEPSHTHRVKLKFEIIGRHNWPRRIARVMHPDGVE